MQEQDEVGTVDRRRLLRRAGTIAVGAAGVTAAGAVVATPAQAAPGDAILISRETNTGDTNSTKATNGSAVNPTLRLENPAAGSALSVNQTPLGSESLNAPVGSVFVNEFGEFAAIGNTDGNGATVPPYLNIAYAPTWATMVVPIRPQRWLDSRTTAGRANIVAGSALFDSSGRVRPRNSNTTPDLILNLSSLFLGGFGAVQANLTVLSPAAFGFAALWDAGTYPGTSSINYHPTMPAVANFTQTVIAEDATRRSIRLKTSAAAHFIIDIVGFVVADPFAQLAGAAAASAGAQTMASSAADGGAQPLWKRRRPTR